MSPFFLPHPSHFPPMSLWGLLYLIETTEHCTCLSVALCGQGSHGSTKILLADTRTPMQWCELIQGSSDGHVTSLKAYHLTPFVWITQTQQGTKTNQKETKHKKLKKNGFWFCFKIQFKWDVAIIAYLLIIYIIIWKYLKWMFNPFLQVIHWLIAFWASQLRCD